LNFNLSEFNIKTVNKQYTLIYPKNLRENSKQRTHTAIVIGLIIAFIYINFKFFLLEKKRKT
jgi:hypothetical protein